MSCGEGGGGNLNLHLRQRWQKWEDDHRESQRRNPFSDSHSVTERLQPGDEGYGLPVQGSQTEQRGTQAQTLVRKEMEELRLIIGKIGQVGTDGKTRVTFRSLFDAYETISNKVVGILLRARKHGLVHFEGEMLWQGRDDQLLITLVD